MGWVKIQNVKELSLVHKISEFVYLTSLAVSNKIKNGTAPDWEVLNKSLEVDLGLSSSEIRSINKVLDTLVNKSKIEIFKLVVSSMIQMMRDEKNNTGFFAVNNHQELIDDLKGLTLSTEDYSPKTRLGQIVLNVFNNLPQVDSINTRQMLRQLTLVNMEIEKKEGFEKTLAIYDMFSSLQLFLQSLITSPTNVDQNHSLNAVILEVSKNNAITSQTRIAAKTRHEKDREKEKPLVDKIIELWEAECAKNPNRKLKQTDAASIIHKVINMNEPLRALYKELRDKDEIDYEKIKSVISKQVAGEKQSKK